MYDVDVADFDFDVCSMIRIRRLKYSLESCVFALLAVPNATTTTYIIGHYNPSIRIIDLVCHLVKPCGHS